MSQQPHGDNYAICFLGSSTKNRATVCVTKDEYIQVFHVASEYYSSYIPDSKKVVSDKFVVPLRLAVDSSTCTNSNPYIIQDYYINKRWINE